MEDIYAFHMILLDVNKYSAGTLWLKWEGAYGRDSMVQDRVKENDVIVLKNDLVIQVIKGRIIISMNKHCITIV